MYLGVAMYLGVFIFDPWIFILHDTTDNRCPLDCFEKYMNLVFTNSCDFHVSVCVLMLLFPPPDAST